MPASVSTFVASYPNEAPTGMIIILRNVSLLSMMLVVLLTTSVPYESRAQDSVGSRGGLPAQDSSSMTIAGDNSLANIKLHPFLGFGLSAFGRDNGLAGGGFGIGVDVGLEDQRFFGRFEAGVNGYDFRVPNGAGSRPIGAPKPDDQLHSVENYAGGTLGIYVVKRFGIGLVILEEWGSVDHYYYTTYPEYEFALVAHSAINVGLQIRWRGENSSTVYNLSYSIRRGIHLGLDFEL